MNKKENKSILNFRYIYLIFLLILISTNTLGEVNSQEKKKFVIPELEKYLLAESDVSNYKLLGQNRFIWPISEKEVKHCVEQSWVLKSDKKDKEDKKDKYFYNAICEFNSPTMAIEAASFYISYMQWIFREGSFTGAIVGDKSWISAQSTGASIVFVRDKYTILVGNSLCKKSERVELEEVAQKILEKIDKVPKK